MNIVLENDCSVERTFRVSLHVLRGGDALIRAALGIQRPVLQYGRRGILTKACSINFS